MCNKHVTTDRCTCAEGDHHLLLKESQTRKVPAPSTKNALPQPPAVRFRSCHFSAASIQRLQKLNKSPASLLFLMHALYSPSSYSGMFWNILGLFWNVLPSPSLPPSRLCSNIIFLTSPALAPRHHLKFKAQSTAHSVTLGPLAPLTLWL